MVAGAGRTSVCIVSAGKCLRPAWAWAMCDRKRLATQTSYTEAGRKRWKAPFP